MLSPLGIFSVGAVNTGLAGALPPVALTAASLQAQVSANAKVGAQIAASPPDLTKILSLLQQLLASLPLNPPSVTAAIAVNASVVAGLSAQLALLEPILALAGALSAGGIYAYAYDGTVGAFGGELTSTIGGGVVGGTGPSQPCQGLVLLAVDPAAWVALSAVLRTV